jgi:hypothetical protein
MAADDIDLLLLLCNARAVLKRGATRHTVATTPMVSMLCMAVPQGFAILLLLEVWSISSTAQVCCLMLFDKHHFK